MDDHDNSYEDTGLVTSRMAHIAYADWRGPEHDPDVVQLAFELGYNDASEGASDFRRRSFKHETGERAAYMNGRLAYHADRILGRVA